MSNIKLVEKFLTEKPIFHDWSNQNTLMIPPEALKYIYHNLNPNSAKRLFLEGLANPI